MNEPMSEPSSRVEPRLSEVRQGTGGSSTETPWHREVLEKVLLEAIVEQRRARRWRIFFRLFGTGLALVFLAFGLGWIGPIDQERDAPHTALVEIEGVIESRSETSADRINEALQAAFAHPRTSAVVLRINSPGGSPVQAGMITDEIRRLRLLHPSRPLYAVVGDICASGGYYVASAADQIFVDKASLLGSIGVLINGFGFTGTMDKLGIERRLIAAGDSKGFLDPFSPLSPSEKEHAARMLQTVHQQFIDTVQVGRAGKLKEHPDLYTGLVWTGVHAIEMGLADRLGSVEFVAREVVQVERVVDFTRRLSLPERLARGAGVGAAESLARVLGVSGWASGLR